MNDKTIRHCFIYTDRGGVIHTKAEIGNATFPPLVFGSPVKAMAKAMQWAVDMCCTTFEYRIEPDIWIYDGLGELIVFSRGNGFDWDGVEKAMAAQTHWGTFEDCPNHIRVGITEEMENLAVLHLRNKGWIIEEYDD